MTKLKKDTQDDEEKKIAEKEAAKDVGSTTSQSQQPQNAAMSVEEWKEKYPGNMQLDYMIGQQQPQQSQQPMQQTQYQPRQFPQQQFPQQTRYQQPQFLQQMSSMPQRRQHAITVGGNQKEDGQKIRKTLLKDYNFKNIDKLNQPIGEEIINNSGNKIKGFEHKIDNYYNEKKSPIALNDIKNNLLFFDNDPKNPMKSLELTFDDRLVFIITTFFIRYLSVILIQWCIDINFIKTFNEGFVYYVIIYLSIFWFIVLFINIDNNEQVDYMNFGNSMNSIRTLFYYFYMGTNGITALFIHSCLIIVLIIIPIVLNITKKEDLEDLEDEEKTNHNILNFDERKKLIKTLSLFTIFIWILTSIIATKF